MLHYTNMANTVGTIFKKINKNKGVNASLYSLLTRLQFLQMGEFFGFNLSRKH